MSDEKCPNCNHSPHSGLCGKSDGFTPSGCHCVFIPPAGRFGTCGNGSKSHQGLHREKVGCWRWTGEDAPQWLASRGLADLSLYWPTNKPIPQIDYASGQAKPSLEELMEAYARSLRGAGEERGPKVICSLCETGADEKFGKVRPAEWTHIRGEYSWRHPLEADRLMSVECAQPEYVAWLESCKNGGVISLSHAFSAGISARLKASESRDQEWRKAARGCESPTALEAILRAGIEGAKTMQRLLNESESREQAMRECLGDAPSSQSSADPDKWMYDYQQWELRVDKLLNGGNDAGN